MAMIPFNDSFFNRELWWPSRSRMLDQYFGMGLLDDALFRSPFPMYPPYSNGQERTGFSEVINEKDKFVIKLDVTHFKPEEIKLKTVDGFLVIEGTHEEKKDEHGFVKRAFTRRYLLPKEIELGSMKSSLSAEGVLTVQAPKKAIAQSPERPIPIQAAPSEGQAEQGKPENVPKNP